MSDEPGSKRADIASWVGTALWIVLLESHIISRPLVFLLGPLLMLLCILLIASPVAANRWRRLITLAAIYVRRRFLVDPVRVPVSRI